MKKTSAQAKALPPPEWLYDRIMLAIEPELTTAQLPDLDTKYVDETSDAYNERMQRYASAFQVFQKLLVDFGDYLYEQSRSVTSQDRKTRTEIEEQESSVNIRLADDIFGASAA